MWMKVKDRYTKNLLTNLPYPRALLTLHPRNFTLWKLNRFHRKQGVYISVLRWCQNSQKGLEPKNVKIWKSSLPCGGLWKNQVCNFHFHLQCSTSEIFRNFCGTFSRHFLLARNSPGRPGRNDILPGLPENFKFPGKIFSLQASQAGELFCLVSLESF